MLEWALRYIRLGWPVIPLWPHDKLGAPTAEYPQGEPIGKQPIGELVPHGSRDATLNETVVRAWWARVPTANIGLASGHRWFALDVDLRKGGLETWDMLRAQHGGVPETIEQVTGGGGRQLLFELPDFPVTNSSDKIAPGIDVRGIGGYIVAPPSIHPLTKRAYDWDGIKELEDQRVAPAPPWLLKLIREGDRRKAGTPTAKTIGAGSRNDTLFRAAARLRRFGWSETEIFASLKAINQERCRPPLAELELRTIAKSSARYQPESGANLFGGAEGEQPAPGELPLTAADVIAAVEKHIETQTLAGVFEPELMIEIARLKPHEIGLIKAKLRMGFGERFSSRDFDNSIRPLAPSNVIVLPVSPGEGSPDEPDLLRFMRSDSGNGERLVALYGDHIRYCVEMQKWLIWDGKRWAVDERDWACQLAKRTARTLRDQVARRAGELGRDDKEIWFRFALRSEQYASIQAALKCAATEQGVAVSANELDQNAYLLNCPNGMVDLKSGALLKHDRSVLITKLCHIEYDPDAKCHQFLKFLHWAMGDNPDSEISPRTMRLCSFLQRAFGYSLTADVSEKAAFVFWGEKGNNGKTTLLTAMKALLGEYATEISIDTLMTTKAQDATLRADLADLRGARFVTTSEVEKEHRLSEGKLKYITAGMGNIKSCRKYENPIVFPATHKLFMDCNHRPVVRGTDDAIWRRLKAVPFEVQISDAELDKKLIDKLLAERAGILAWAVRGCAAWIKDGLGETPEIDAANTAWREHDDPLKEFFEDCCEIEEDAWVRNSELSTAYAWWCKKNRENYPLGRQAFSERIQAKGFQLSRSRRSSDGKQMRTVEGVRVKDEISKQISSDGGSFHRLPD